MENQLVWTSPRKGLYLKNQELVHSNKEISHPVNSEDSTIEVIFQLPLNMVLKTEFTGKLRSNNLITITICPSSLKVLEKNKTHTDFWLFKVSSTCSRRVELRFSQLFLNSLFQLRPHSIQEMAKLSQLLLKSYKLSSHAQTLLERLLCLTTDRSCPWWTYLRLGIKT